jgi:hypothetical protein
MPPIMKMQGGYVGYPADRGNLERFSYEPFRTRSVAQEGASHGDHHSIPEGK